MNLRLFLTTSIVMFTVSVFALGTGNNKQPEVTKLEPEYTLPDAEPESDLYKIYQARYTEDPEKAATLLRLIHETGQPPEYVNANLEMLDKSSKIKTSSDFWKNIEEISPAVANWLKEQNNMEVTHRYNYTPLLAILTVLCILAFIVWCTNPKHRKALILWIVLAIVDFYLLASLKKTITGPNIILLIIFFSINVPVFLKNWLKQLANIDDFKITNIKLNYKTLLLVGIIILLLSFLKQLFLPTLGLFIVVLCVWVAIIKKINKRV